MAPLKDFISKFGDYKKNKQLILSTAAIALLLLSASIVAVTTATSKSNQNIKTLSTTTHDVVSDTGEKLPLSPKDILEASLNLTIKTVKYHRAAMVEAIERNGMAEYTPKAVIDCVALTDETLYDLEEARKDLKKDSYEDFMKKYSVDLKTLYSSMNTRRQTCLDDVREARKIDRLAPFC